MCFFVRASLCFAYLITLASAAGLVISVILGEVLIGHVIDDTKDRVVYNYLYNDVNKLKDITSTLAMSLVCLTGGVVSFVSFIFSVLLCDGIRKRQPEEVKAYLTFGGTLSVLVAIAATIHMNAYNADSGRYALIATGVYMFCLAVVYITYKKMTRAVTWK